MMLNAQPTRQTLYSARHRGENWLRIAAMAAKHGPVDMARELRRYPWLLTLLNVDTLLTRLSEGRSERYNQACGIAINNIVAGIMEMCDTAFHHPDRMVIHEDLVPPEILFAMGLRTWCAEILGILLPVVRPEAAERYIDACENAGIPPDTCSLPKSTLGIVLSGQMPRPRALLASNLPCDSGMSSYTIMEKELGAPAFRLDAPHDFKSERAVAYFVGQLEEMIGWLEERTPGRMDWDRLREICEERNRMVEAEWELWDMMRNRPAPMAAEAIYMSHFWCFNVFPGRPESTRVFEKIRDLAAQNMAEGVSAFDREEHRALLWNPPTAHFVDLFSWAEQKYGVAMIMDSMSYSRLPLIDTSTRRTMLEGLSRNIMNGPMARHTRGPIANYFDDIFHIHETYGIDMLWMAGHVGCKNTQALNQILREKCRERSLPLLVINYDLSDTRVESSRG
ncbi:MAG: 2-hydroxyacyl-CoA dehydratase subunit D, partial [Desulfatibacillaceae bacterium]